MKTVNIIAKDVQLMVDEEKLGDAIASISLNPNVAWLKMVITDDKPNANAMRIPKEEFESVLKTAIYMPVKMAEDEISEGHDETYPLGSIAHLVEKGDHIVALAALWTKERPDDVEYLKERHENGQSIDVSWELSYDVEASEKDDKGILELRNVEMNAVTIVGLPSYMGRTPVTEIASKKKKKNRGDKTMDTINRVDHDKIVEGLNGEINDLKDELTAATTELEELRPMKEELATLKSEFDGMKAGFDELTVFKTTIDAKKDKEEKLVAIREKFAEAGLKAPDEYFADREATLLDMSDEQLDFFIQEFIAFKKEPDTSESAEASISITSKLPGLSGETQGDVENKDAVEFLHSLDKKE